MELLRIYNKYGETTTDVAERNEAHAQGLFHRVFHLWIVNSKTQILIQQRSAIKDTGANLWYVSVGGHIEHNESIEQAMVREVKEELGVDIENLTEQIQFLYTFYEKMSENNGSHIDREFYDVFLLRGDVPLDSIVMQESEVQAVQYMDYANFKDQIMNPNSAFVEHRTAYKMLIIALDDCMQ